VKSGTPSRTAALIAAATVRHARDPLRAALAPPPMAGLSAAFLRAGGFRLMRLLASPVGALPAAALERLTVPGLTQHFLARKRFIEDEAVRALGEGFTRMTVIGAGFDTLALRLAARGAGAPEARFAEIDHPATQAVKRAALVAPPVAWRAQAADLASVPLGQALAETWPEETEPSHAAPMLVIAEGVLMYLDRARVEALFAALRPWGRAQRLVFSFMEPAPDGRIAFHNATALTRGLLGAWGEPFTWGVRRDALADFLAPLGYRVSVLVPGADLAARAGLPLPHAIGETLCVAERGAPC